jgi:hypothetical protein
VSGIRILEGVGRSLVRLQFLETTNSLPFRQNIGCIGICKNNQKFAHPSKALPLSNLSRFSKTIDPGIGISNQQLADFLS